MAKQLNVNLGFNADVSQAKQALSDLNNSLKQISTINIGGSTNLLNQDMQSAVASAKQLQMHLQQAFNAKTGNIDLSLLNNSLKSANTDLATLTTNLLKCGTQGQQAFMNVQKVISNASVQINKANGVLTNFWTTLKNTARWQLSSSVLHGFMGAMQSAYGYAQDLDKSLNNIRIVTGYNADEMAKFAEQANKAAKNLNTTTTAYTNASLIYYQQGLKGEDVTERSDVTVKMANVTGETASDVSNYMTAIWNNFDDGSKSLEYYADVMTALGAATASSTDEIAAGLEKFAAVSETVGLSYEYATSALATVTATTRQSADVVGNAFKTLFSRIQGLNLGETLDDGTDLNKYSAALDKVGISIKDVNGDVKEMDTILDELGNRWGELAKDEQLAVAQTVAGVRQYTQLIALMDNWDFFQENLGTAKNAEGELNKQAEIYAESWEAANKKVKASMQGLYQDLIPEEFIIKFTNGLADVIDGVDGVIDSIGGLKTILLLISSIVLTKMGPQMATSIDSIIGKIGNLNINLQSLSKGWTPFYVEAKKAKDVLTQISQTTDLGKQLDIYSQSISSSNTKMLDHSTLINRTAGSVKVLSDSFRQYISDTQQVYNLQGVILNSKKSLTNEEQEELSVLQKELLALAEKKQKQQEYVELVRQGLETRLSTPNIDLYESAGFQMTESSSSFESNIRSVQSQVQTINTFIKSFGDTFKDAGASVAIINGHLGATSTSAEGITKAAQLSAQEYAKLVEFSQVLSRTAKSQGADFDKLKASLTKMVQETNKIPQGLKEGDKGYLKLIKDSTSLKDLQSKISEANAKNVHTMELYARSCGNSKEHLTNIESEILKIVEAQIKVNNTVVEYNNALTNTVQRINNILDRAVSVGTAMSKLAQGASTVAMGISSISSAINTFKSPDTTWVEKLTAGSFAAVSGIRAMQVGIEGVRTTMATIAAVQQSYNAIKAISNMLDKENLVVAQATRQGLIAEIKAVLGLEAAEKLHIASLGVEQKTILANFLVRKLKVKETEKEAFVTAINESATLKEIFAIVKNTAVKQANMLATLGWIGAIIAVAAAIGIAVAAIIKAQKTEEEAYEATVDATKKLKEAAEEAKNEAKEIKDTFDSYNSVIEALNNCEKGTKEWYDALQGVKDEIDSILDKYPELLKNKDALQWDENTGTYLLNPDVMQQMVDDAQKKADTVSFGAAMNTGMEQARQADIKKKEANDIFDFYGYIFGDGSNVFDQLVGKNTAEMSETLAGYVENYLNGMNGTNWQYTNLDGENITIDEYIQENFSHIFDEVIQVMSEYSDAVEQQSTILLNGAKELASEHYGDRSKDEQDVAAKIIKSNYEDIYADVMELSRSQYDKIDTETAIGTHGEEDIITRYETATQRDDYDWVGVTGNDDNRKYVYEEDGKEVELTPEDIAAAVAAYESVYAEESKLETEQAMDTVANILKDATTAGANLIAGLTSSETTKQGADSFVTTLSPDQLDMISQGITVNEDGSTSIKTDTLDSLGMTIDEFNQLAEAIGISGSQLATALYNSAIEYDKVQAESKQKILDSATKTTRDLLADSTENLSTTATKNIVDAVETALGESGVAGAEAVSSAFEKALKTDDAEEFAQAIEGIDWETIDAETLGEKLEAAGVDANYTTTELIEFIDAMNGVKEATAEAAQEMFTSFQDLGNLKMGDTVTQEQMNAMIAENPAFAQYFTKGVDGNYTLTEDTAHFQGLAEDISYKGQYDYIKGLQDRYDQMSALSESNFNYQGSVGSMRTAGIDLSNDMGGVANDYSTSLNSSLDYLSAVGYDQTQIADWQNRASELSGSDFTQIAQALEECGDVTGDWENEMSELENTMGEAENAIDFSRYKDQVSDLGLDFETTERYAQDLKEAMEESGKEYDNIEHSARQVAIANQRLDRGLSNLASNLDDYKEKLQDTNKYSTEYGEALQGLKTDVADIFNTDASLLSDGFIEEQLVGDPEKLVQIADGNMEVINGMRQAVAEEIITNVKTRVDASELDQFNAWYAQFQANFPDLQTGVFLDGQSEAAFIESLNGMIAAAGMTHDEVNALLGSMGMSAELETTYKSQMVEVPIYTTMTKETGSTTASGQRTLPDGTIEDFTDTYPTTETMTYQSGVAQMQGFVPVTSIKTIADNGTESGGGIDIHTSSDTGGAPSGRTSSAPSISPSASNVYNPDTGKGGYTGNKNSGGGGGGGSKEPQEVDLTDKDKEIDRYKEIDDVLESIERQLKKIQRAEDTLYGASKIAAMEHEVQVLKEQEAAYKAKAAAAREYIDTDRQAIAALGYSVSYDAEGNIANYNELMSNAIITLNSYKSQYNSMTAEQQEAFQQVLDAAEQRYEDLKNAMSQYEETLQAFRDAEDAAEEARLQRLAKNYEILAHELEYKLYNIEARIKEIDYYVDKLSDDFYSMGEALAILSGKTDEYFNVLGQYGTFVDKLHSQYAAGEITQADYVDGLKDSYDAILDNLEALQELDKTMLEYYGETLEMAKEELEKYTNQIDHLNDVLDHYQSIMKLIGKETNYDQMGALLEGQAKIRRDSMDVAKANYEMLKREKEAILESLNSVEKGSDAWEVYKKQLDDITEALIEAENEMLTRTEEWAEAMKSVLENDLAKAYQNLEKAFTNELGFDYLNDSVDRIREQYDLLLTETNKLYETNKLMNSAQNKADQATSQVSKQKLKNFINETQALQDKTQLSKIELEIQQAKYDLLLAEIALEEAQNAKSRVRLQRDAEGNFNYVYTSDAEAISNAEQELADKENALYNIRLEAANAAGEQMLATAEAWVDAIYQVDLDYMNGVITSEEEWRRRRAEINDQYSKIMQLHQDNYNEATWEDSRIVAESWCNEDTGAYPLIIQKGKDWMTATGEYIDTVDIAFKDWQSVVEEMTGLVGGDLDETTQKVEELTDASESLKDEIIGEVIPAIESELNSVRDLTSAYASQRSEIMSLISQYEALARSIREAIQAQSELNSYTPPASPNLSQDVPGGPVTDPPLASPKDDKTGGHTGGGGGGGKDENTWGARTIAADKNGYHYYAQGFPSYATCEAAFTNYVTKSGAGPINFYVAPDSGKKVQKMWRVKSNNNSAGAKPTVSAFDTGGYTGSWGSEGKLATLHEKELVLNKTDTKNMLTAVEIVRDINHQIENSAKYFGSIGANIHLPGISDMSQILEQTVHIDANFPSVKDKFEIEQAFENIVNMASQFANRKKL